MLDSISTIHLQRLKQLEDAFGMGDIETNIVELSEVLFCSTRNVTKVMKKLQALELITWVAGRGRGNKSHFSILSRFEELLSKHVQYKIQQGRLNDAHQFAEVFHYQEWFRQNLPHWLEAYSENIEHNDQILFLIPYNLPRCHPLDLFDIHAGLYAKVLFDTLIRYEPSTGQFAPHLAHQFQKTDFGYAFRIRPNVHFHNGVLLTPQLVCEHFKKLKQGSALYTQLLDCVERFKVNKQWVEMHLNRHDPMLLHLLADLHFSLFLEDPHNEAFPIGTGAYRWEARTSSHWSLIKNERYFGISGIVSRADFWHLDTSHTILHPYVIEYETINTSESLGNEEIQINGCNAVCFSHRLPQITRQQLVRLCQQELKEVNEAPKNLCTTLIGYSEALDIKNTTKSHGEVISDSIAFSTLHYLSKDGEILKPVLDALAKHDVVLIQTEHIEEADFWIGDYSFGNDVTLGQYYWLLCSDYANLVLPDFERQHWLNNISKTHSLPDLFYQLEQDCIDNFRILPLWRKASRFKCHSAVRGNQANSLGLMNLAEVWLDKREY